MRSTTSSASSLQPPDIILCYTVHVRLSYLTLSELYPWRALQVPWHQAAEALITATHARQTLAGNACHAQASTVQVRTVWLWSAGPRARAPRSGG